MTFPILKGLFRYEITDHHAILGVPVGADVEKMRERYLKIAYRLHPDTCKNKTPQGKQQASHLLSRMVNPSYEKLSREASRSEYLIVLSQSSRMITEKDASSVESEAAKKLLKQHKDLELAYFKLLSLLINHQYDDLDKIYEKIAEISELNLVYLFRKQQAGASHPTQVHPQRQEPTVTSSKTSQPQANTSQPSQKVSESDKTTSTSTQDNYIRRAQDCLDRGNFDQAILEMRDALKSDPKNGRYHALMGLAYIKKNQLSMAKVHVDTALKAEPYDPLVRQISQEYRKLVPHPTSKTKKSQGDESKKTGFWNWGRK